MRKVVRLGETTGHTLTPTLSKRERGPAAQTKNALTEAAPTDATQGEQAAQKERGPGQIVEIGGMLFSSTIAGADPDTGELSPRIDEQAGAAFRNLQRLLDMTGTGPNEVGLVRIAVTAPGLGGPPGGAAEVAAALDAAWSSVFGRADPGPARRIDVYELPAGELVQLQVIGVRGQAGRQVAAPGIFPAGALPTGRQVGDVLFSSSIVGVDPQTGRLVEERRAQIDQAFCNVEALVREAGGTMDDVAHVFIYVRDRADNDDVLEAFLDAFPTGGNRAARKNVFDDQLRGADTVVQLQVIAVLGPVLGQRKRQNYEVPGAAKKHPNPLGTRIGNLLFSAGIGGQDLAGPEVERQAARALSNVRALMEQAGGSLADVAHVTFTVDDYAHTPIIDREWRKLFPDPADEPARHIMAFGGRDGSYQVQVHAIAVLGTDR